MFVDIVIQSVGKADELPLDRLAGGVLIDGIRSKFFVRIVDGRISFALPVAPSLSFLYKAFSVSFYFINILPFETELMHLHQGAVVFVFKSPLDTLFQLTRVNHNGVGKLFAPLGGTCLPTVTAGLESAL